MFRAGMYTTGRTEGQLKKDNKTCLEYMNYKEDSDKLEGAASKC